MTSAAQPPARLSTGIAGLDGITGGGLPAASVYLVQGDPGVGKTTLSLQFLLEGVRRGEKVLYVTLSETQREIAEVARSHGWSIDGIEMYELSAAEERLSRESEQTMFHPSEVELEEAISPIFKEIERVKPTRLVIDSLSEIRLLAREPLRYRRQVLSLKQHLSTRGCTVYLVDDKTDGADGILQTVAHGVIQLEALLPAYGSSRRRLSIAKLRGVRFKEGYHDYRVETGGILVFPRLVASDHAVEFPHGVVQSGVPELDALLSGGLPRGTTTLLLGAAGTGKSALGQQYAYAAALRGETTSFFLFEESLTTWRARAISLGLDLEQFLKSGLVKIQQVDPAELSPGELASRVRASVEVGGSRLVVIDSLNGYMQSVPDERFLLLHLHELITYLGQRGVMTLLTLAQSGSIGGSMHSPVDVSYLADSVILMRYFEARGSVRQAISVVKKRIGGHERSLREFAVTTGGIRVGKPLTEFHGVLTGVPTFRGDDAELDPLLAK